MMLGARTGAWSGKRLPYDAEVEYIRAIGDSENSPWIDTKVRVIYGDEIYVEIMPASVTTKFSIGSVIFSDFFATKISGGGVGISRFFGAPVCAYFLEKRFTSTVANYGKSLVSYKLNRNVLLVNADGVENEYGLVDILSYTEDRDTVGIFGCSKRNTHPIYDFCCVKFSITRNGIVITDLVPVRFTNDNGENEGAMYDRVSGHLFRNSGTGAFIVGPDK